MGRIIIDFPNGVTPQEAMRLVSQVVAGGKVSQASDIPHYCWATVEHQKDYDLTVWTRRKKKGQKSDSFRIFRDKPLNFVYK